MAKVLVLDCTLRDGGYCNEWLFGKSNIKKIVKNLAEANVDIVECGFLTNRIRYNGDRTKYTDVNQVNDFIPNNSKCKYVLMINYGEYSLEDIPNCCETKIDGIRVAFHKNDMNSALPYCRTLKEKGYLVFMQPMVSMSYSDEEFVELIKKTNEFSPYAFYIVDSFGTMKKQDVDHYYSLVKRCLNDDIIIGLHAHNNLQNAYANVLYLLEQMESREIIIDVTVHGMGRGAGNLNTEIFINDLNNNKYLIEPLLQIIDDILSEFYEEKPWGYSLPNYLSAVHMVHPNYAEYLSKKKTLTMEDINNIFSLIKKEKRVEFDKQYIEALYLQYMSMGNVRIENLQNLSKIIRNKKVLLIAPGQQAFFESNKILEFVKNNDVIVVSINYDYTLVNTNFVFVSNKRRFRKLSPEVYNKTIITSNIKSIETYACVDYFELTNATEFVKDNAGLMAIKLFIEKLNANQLYIAGMDGYTHDVYENYENKDMALVMTTDSLDKINEGMKKELKKYMNKITFLTQTRLQ